MTRRTWRAAAVIAIAWFGVIGCGSSVQGTYSSTSGTMMLALQSGGKAAFTMMGETQDCTYTAGAKNIHLNCGKDETDFHIMDDGSLTSSTPFIAATFGALRKTK